MTDTEWVMVERKALELAAKNIRANLHHQREKVMDSAALLEDALSGNYLLSASPVPPSEPVGWMPIETAPFSQQGRG